MARFIILCTDMFLWGLRLVLNQSVSVYWVSVRWYILSLKKDWKNWNYRKKKTANTGHLPSWTGCNSSAGPVPDGIGLTYQYAAGLINTTSVELYLGVGVLQTLLLVAWYKPIPGCMPYTRLELSNLSIRYWIGYTIYTKS